MTIAMQISSVERGTCTKQLDPTIPAPEGWEPVLLPDGLRLYCSGSAYAGWLAKFVNPLPYDFTKISMSFSLLIDDAVLQQAQGIEFDSKFTDSSGWTYDGSGLLNIANGWEFNNSDPWRPTGVKIIAPSPSVWLPIQVDYVLDYTAHALYTVALTCGGVKQVIPLAVQSVPAKQMGWAPNQVVTQLQPGNNGLRGAHSWKIRDLLYQMTI